jgi:hypothetical protein
VRPHHSRKGIVHQPAGPLRWARRLRLQGENCASGMRGVLNDAISIYFADATLASAFVARWCVASKVETAGGVFQVREDEHDAAGWGGAAPDTITDLAAAGLKIACSRCATACEPPCRHRRSAMNAPGLALVAALAVTLPIAAHANRPGPDLRPVNAGPALAIVLAWDGGGSGRQSAGNGDHPTGAHVHQGNGGWLRPPWEPHRRGWGPYGWHGVPTYWVWGPRGGAFDYPDLLGQWP